MKIHANYIVLIITNLLTLLLIGLQPTYLMFQSGEEMEGLLPMMLTFIAWIPAAVIAVIIFELIRSFFKLKKINIAGVIAISLIINIVAALAVPVTIVYGISMYAQSKHEFKVDYSIESESIIGDQYSYTLHINNNAKKTFKNVVITVDIVVTSNADPGYDRLFITSSRSTYLDIPPGESQITDVLKIENGPIPREIPENPEFKILLIYQYYSQQEKYLDSKLDWEQVYHENRDLFDP